MIDVEKPMVQPTPQMVTKPSSTKKVVFIVIAVILVAILTFWLWLIFRTSITVTLVEGESYDFKNLKIRVENITSSICPDQEGFECAEWHKEDGVTLRIDNTETKDVSFEYLGENSRSEADSKNVYLTLISSDPESGQVEVKIKVK